MSKKKKAERLTPERIRDMRKLYRYNFKRLAAIVSINESPEFVYLASPLCMIADELEYANNLKEIELKIRVPKEGEEDE